MTKRCYLDHLQSADDLITTDAAKRAFAAAVRIERDRRTEPYLAQARALQHVVSHARSPSDLSAIRGIEGALLIAAGLPESELPRLQADTKLQAIETLIKDTLEPAGVGFAEKLVAQFLHARNGTLDDSMPTVGDFLAQQKLTHSIMAALSIAGIKHRWQDARGRWSSTSKSGWDPDTSVRGLTWKTDNGPRTLLYNLSVPLVKSNVDLCLFNLDPQHLKAYGYGLAGSYIALGELKGGIDPAGADEHWKTARTALNRIRDAFADTDSSPYTFFVGAAIEKRMAKEIWRDLESGELSNAANLNETTQIASISGWLASL